MAEDIDVCFSKNFLKNLRKSYPDTDPNKFKEYLKKIICEAMEKMNSVENGIRLKKICFDTDQKCPEMSISLDGASRRNETAYLQVPEEIVKSQIHIHKKGKKKGELIKDIICELKSQECFKSTRVFSCRNLVHEFGHLQDAQRKEFGYTHEYRDLNDLIDVIWNVLLEGKFSRSQISAGNKEENWDYYRRKLGDLKVRPDRKNFEHLWKKRNYCFQEIIDWAQSYSDASQVDHS